MKTFFIILLLTIVTSAQEVPTSNPSEVWVKGRLVPHGWRDGRIFVPSTQIGPLLNIQPELPSVDLIEALDAKGGYVYRVVEGRFEAVRDRSGYADYQGSQRAQSQNQRYNRAYAEYKDEKEQQEATQPKLVHEVQRFVAETGYVRAFVRVMNQGGGPSEAVLMVADLTDGYGKAFARDTKPIPTLKPGEYIDVEVFSMVEDDETVVNGVVRTINSEKVRVTFQEL